MSVGTFVYAFQVKPDGPIKIGVTDEPERRFKALDGAIPWELERLAIVPGSRTNETWMHVRLMKYRLKGEWFENNEEVLKLVLKIADPKWVWPDVKKSRARTPRSFNSIGEEMRCLVKDALGAALPGEKVNHQVDRVTKILGLENKKWLVRAAWYGEASPWSALVADDFRNRCRAAISSRRIAA